MPTLPNPKLLLPALVLAALLAFPALAGATLAYVKNPFNATVYVANDDGSGAKKIDKGHNPRVSPDGAWVAYLYEGPKFAQELKLAPGHGRRRDDADDQLPRSLLPRLVAGLEDDRGPARA